MNDQQVKNLIQWTFDKIESAETIKEIDDILNDPKIYENRMNEDSYPKLKFKIDKKEIEDLKSRRILNQNNSISNEVSGTSMDTLTKLLYAVSWKNGDLKKIKHIVDGVTSKEAINRKTGLVFYQFGKYLTKEPNEPIIDQHVLRAFAIYKAIKENQGIDSSRKISLITEKQVGLINDYKTWLKSELQGGLVKESDYTYHIDKVLFAVGKTVKPKKNDKEN